MAWPRNPATTRLGTTRKTNKNPTNIVAEKIAKLGSADQCRGKLANAIRSTTAETIAATAAAEAQKAIDELVATATQHKLTVTEAQKKKSPN